MFLHFVPHCYIFVPPIFVPIGDNVDSETSLLCFASLLCLPLLCFVSLSLFRIEFCSKLTLNQSRAEFILDILRATPSAAGPHSPEEGCGGGDLFDVFWNFQKSVKKQ